MRRRKITYPKAKTATSGVPAPGADERAAAAASRTVTINLAAMGAASMVRAGDRVQIASGLFAGDLATVESVVGGVIPAVLVRTDAGRTRRIRAIDLVPAPREASPQDT